MIKSLSVENFKAFRKSQFDFNALTVLTGMNSTGKSTVIQALLIAQLAAECDGGRVPLNGPYGLALGEALNVLNASADEQLIKLRLTGDSGIEEVHLSVPNDRSLALDLVKPKSPTDRNTIHTFWLGFDCLCDGQRCSDFAHRPSACAA